MRTANRHVLSDVVALPEPFRVEIRPDRQRVFVEPHGELDLDTVDDLRAAVDDLALRGFEAIVIDLRATTFLDSSGLHLLIAQAARTEVADHADRRLEGRHVVEPVRELHVDTHRPGLAARVRRALAHGSAMRSAMLLLFLEPAAHMPRLCVG